MKKRLIKFGWLPTHWGLKGVAREEAKAFYELEGCELELKLNSLWHRGVDLEMRNLDTKLAHAEISNEDYDYGYANLIQDEITRKRKLLDLDLKYGHINEYSYDMGKLELDYPTHNVDRKLAELEINHKHRKIDDLTYEKNSHTLREEPWVKITDINFDENRPDLGFLSVDYNSFFIEYLEANGYVGKTESETLNLWITEIARNIALDRFSGIGENDELLGKK